MHFTFTQITGAALGMRFDTTAQASGAVSMLVARQGSHPPTRAGYDVMRVTMPPGQAPRMESFLTSLLQGRRYWGRPVDVLVMRDGSVLVSDDCRSACRTRMSKMFSPQAS